MAHMTCPEAGLMRDDRPRHAHRLTRAWLPLLCLVLSVLFAGLAYWQLLRLHWKQSLIDQVQRNTQSAPVRLNEASQLSALRAGQDAYRRIHLRGQPDCAKATPVWAATALGTGYWWMIPVQLSDQQWVWVNRGYVSADFVRHWRGQTTQDCPAIELVGLLRNSQTGGGFLRPNNPAQNRWYSRDVAALSKHVGLAARSTGIAGVDTVWFIDQWPSAALTSQSVALGGQPAPDLQPVPGLTPLQWPNKHLAYALTWMSLSVFGLFAALFSAARVRRFVVKCSRR
jgi:surfeit locus 1 family protein